MFCSLITCSTCNGVSGRSHAYKEATSTGAVPWRSRYVRGGGHGRRGRAGGAGRRRCAPGCTGPDGGCGERPGGRRWGPAGSSASTSASTSFLAERPASFPSLLPSSLTTVGSSLPVCYECTYMKLRWPKGDCLKTKDGFDDDDDDREGFRWGDQKWSLSMGWRGIECFILDPNSCCNRPCVALCSSQFRIRLIGLSSEFMHRVLVLLGRLCVYGNKEKEIRLLENAFRRVHKNTAAFFILQVWYCHHCSQEETLNHKAQPSKLPIIGCWAWELVRPNFEGNNFWLCSILVARKI